MGIEKPDERFAMPSAIQIISKLRLLKLKIPPTGMNLCGYEIASGKKPGRPKSWAGNFAVVVPARKICNGSNEGNFALRFFLAKTPSHITQITSFINNNPHPALVGCKMYRNTLELKSGEKVDLMEMDFIDGLTLDDWIEERMLAGDTSSLRGMAEAIRATINQLVNVGFYHGDLSHSNIMISKTGNSAIDKIRLIDYDSVLVKGIQNPPETKETGHPNFQHPSRKASRFTMLEDVYFTTLVIYVSLIAISENSALWQAGIEDRNFHSKGDNLLFQSQRDDLKQTNTDLWKELDKINFPEETGRAYSCLKSAVNTSELVSSNFLSEIEEWFSTGTIPTQTNPPSPHTNPNPTNSNLPSPTPSPNNKPAPSPSPKPVSKKAKRPPSPKPQPRGKAAKSPSPKLRQKLNETLKAISDELSMKPVHSNSTPNVPVDGSTNDVKDTLEENGTEKQPTEEVTTEEPRKDENNRKKGERPRVRPDLLDEGHSIKPKKSSKKASKSSTKKKSKNTIPVDFSDLTDKNIVIDGANILHECSSAAKHLELDPLKKFIEVLESANVASLSIVFDASTQHKFSKDDAVEFISMINDNKSNYTLAPKATDADSIVLNIAHKTESIVVTNDFYEDYKEKLPEAYNWFTSNHITASYVMGIWSMNTTNSNEFMNE